MYQNVYGRGGQQGGYAAPIAPGRGGPPPYDPMTAMHAASVFPPPYMVPPAPPLYAGYGQAYQGPGYGAQGQVQAHGQGYGAQGGAGQAYGQGYGQPAGYVGIQAAAGYVGAQGATGYGAGAGQGAGAQGQRTSGRWGPVDQQPNVGPGGGGDRPRRQFSEVPPPREMRQHDPRDPGQEPERYGGRGRDRERERTPDPDQRRYAPAGRVDAAQPSTSARGGGGGGGGGGVGYQRDRDGATADVGAPRRPQYYQEPGRQDGWQGGGGRGGGGATAGPSGAGAYATGGGAGGGGRGGGGSAAAASGGSGGGGSGGGNAGRVDYVSRQGHVYTVLGRNIRSVVAALTPSAEEEAVREEVLAAVSQAAAAAFPEGRGRLRVEPFGSYTSGLGTTSSDIDVVLVGLAEPSSNLGFYSRDERPRVARLLDRLTPHLRSRLRLTKLLPIRHARVPILKLATSDGIAIDISIASMSGPRAAQYMRQQVTAFPALRPLVLVMKSYMKAEGLAEVATGGLSSYGLTFMILAHLMEESKRGTDVADWGWLLHSLLRRFGRSFDVGSMAVSVRDGGLVPKSVLGVDHVDHGDRIVTIDPLTGRNCTEGTFRSREVLDAMARADTYLAAWVGRKDAEAAVPPDADILGPLVTAVPCEDEEPYGQTYAPPGGGNALGKRGRSQDMSANGGV